MRKGCCILSLILDTGNFDALWIDGKVVSKMFFNGDKIYDNSRWFAYGSLFKGSITSMWGNNSKKLVTATNTSASYGNCIGMLRTTSSGQPNSSLYSTDESHSEFTLLGKYYLRNLKSALNIDSFLECKSIYYVTRFKQNTYNGDLLIKPFIFFGRSSTNYSSIDKVMGLVAGTTTYYAGIGNETADTTDNGFCYVYKSSNKGKTVQHVAKFNETHIDDLERESSVNTAYYPYFLCKAFKTDASANTITATAYYGGYLLFEI